MPTREGQAVNRFGGTIQIERIEDDAYWIEQRCAVQSDGSTYCELRDGFKVEVCAAIGCNCPADEGGRFCRNCGNNDYPHH